MRKAREPNDKLDRVTDKTLAEVDRKALHGLCVAILNLIRASIGSQWSLLRPRQIIFNFYSISYTLTSVTRHF